MTGINHKSELRRERLAGEKPQVPYDVSPPSSAFKEGARLCPAKARQEEWYRGNIIVSIFVSFAV